MSRKLQKYYAGIAQLARASAFQAEGCGFESHCPLQFLKTAIKVGSTKIIYYSLLLFIIWEYSSVG